MKNWLKRAAIGCMLLLALSAGAARAERPEQSRETLENQAFLAGEAKPGAFLECIVYMGGEEEEDRTLLYQTEQTVGTSGLYQLTVPLPVLGKQCVLLRIDGAETVYEYTRYSKRLAKELKGYYLNIYRTLIEEPQ